MPEAAAKIGRAAHLPEQPGQAFRAQCGIDRHQFLMFGRQIHQDRAGFEHAGRRIGAVIHQRRNFRVRVSLDESAAELVAVADPDQPGIVFRTLVAQRQQFLQHHRHLHAVRRAQRVELQRVLADRQFLLVRRAGNRAVGAGKRPRVLAVPFPDLRRRVGRCVAHPEISHLSGGHDPGFRSFPQLNHMRCRPSIESLPHGIFTGRDFAAVHGFPTCRALDFRIR